MQAPFESAPENLQEMLAYWQKVLRLGDWDIDAELVPFGELEDGTMACNMVDLHMRVAKVSVCRPEDQSCFKGLLWEYDMERLLIHELIHIPLLAWEPEGELEECNHEFAINLLSQALVGLKRKALGMSSEAKI
jgi:hypothetical protein